MEKSWILIGILLSFLISLSSFLSIVFLSNPEQGFIFILLFYVSLFIVLFSLFFLIIFIYNKISRTKIGNFSVNIKQGFLLASIIILILIFQNLKILKWWNLIILFIIFLFVEIFLYKRIL